LWGDYTSLYVDGKRPFGNSGTAMEIARVLGWDCDVGKDGDPQLSAAQTERAWELFDQLPFALQEIVTAAEPDNARNPASTR
jgi:hypothetical protein